MPLGLVTMWPKRVDEQVKSESFKPSSLISALFFLQNIQTVWDINGIIEAATMWLFPNFMKDPAKARSAHRVCATKENELQQEGKLTTSYLVIKYSLATYTAEDVIVDIEARKSIF